jgi:acetyl-CoA carboxylase biotin carboxyl carrier protein
MSSPLERIAEIAAWLAATDIDLLEVTGPDGSLRLQRGRDGAAVVAETGTAPPVAALVPSAERPDAAQAPIAGRFLHAHPLHDAPLASPGKRVKAGQPIGLVQVGALLLPVSAPRHGVVASMLAADGSLVGYGDRLIELRRA